MDTLFRSPLFGIMLSILAYGLGVLINRKTRCAAANPLLIAILLVIGVLVAFRIPLESYQRGGDFIALFLAPATASLAVSIYRQTLAEEKSSAGAGRLRDRLPGLYGERLASLQAVPAGRGADRFPASQVRHHPYCH